MTTYLLITAVVIFACVFLSKVSSRLGIPMLLAFILLGMLFGSDGILKIPFDNYAFAEQICTDAASVEPISAPISILSTHAICKA